MNINITEFSFKTSEIVIDNNNEVYLSKFNDIALINIEEKQEEEEDDDNNKTIIIVVCVICVVVVATGVIVTIYLIKRKPKASGNETDEKEIKDKNIRQTNEAMNEDENGNKVIEFKN
jgi:heme/copper-type cytochrome/quinol oxidase subunit 2